MKRCEPRFLFGPALLMLTAAPSLQAADIEIVNPAGGWRNSAGQKMSFTQEVNYPASSVNTPDDQNAYGLISGKIRSTKKSEKNEPHRLIVNGVAMPLSVNETTFSRPYLFGAGSNNVEVRSPDGKSRDRVQFYESNPNTTRPNLSVLLAWDTDQTDLDLHVVSPDGQHVWYGNRVVANGGALDIDVTTGYGPEIYSTPSPPKGVYLVYVNYYGSRGGSDLTVTQVTIITNQNSVDEKKETFTVPMRKPGDLTLVHSFIVQ